MSSIWNRIFSVMLVVYEIGYCGKVRVVLVPYRIGYCSKVWNILVLYMKWDTKASIELSQFMEQVIAAIWHGGVRRKGPVLFTCKNVIQNILDIHNSARLSRPVVFLSVQ